MEAPQGQNGLSTLRLAIELRGPLSVGGGRHTVRVVDRQYAERGGWRELAAESSPWGRVVSSSLPWFGTARAATGEVESTLFEGAVADLGASFQVSGLRARLELPRAWGVPAPVVSGIRPRVIDEAATGADARTEPPPKP